MTLEAARQRGINYQMKGATVRGPRQGASEEPTNDRRELLGTSVRHQEGKAVF